MTKPLRWLGGTEIRTPPVSIEVRRRLGAALRVLQEGGRLSMPLSRSMPSIGPRCHELRIGDGLRQWRLVYQIDLDAILVVDLFQKSTRATSRIDLERCRRRLRQYGG